MIDWIKLNLKNKPKITIHDLFIEPYPHRHRYLHPPTRIILSSFSSPHPRETATEPETKVHPVTLSSENHSI